MKKDLTAIPELNAEEVSLVTRGANKKKRFPIVKEENLMNPDTIEILSSVIETEVEEEGILKEWLEKGGLSDKGKAAIKSALRILASYKDELPDDAMEKLASAAGVTKQNPEEEDEEEEVEMKKELEGIPEEMQAKFEAVMKAQEDQLAVLKEENERIAKALKAEKDARELEAWIKKAEEELSHYPGKSSEELGKMLKELNEVNPKIAEEQFAAMKSASESLKQSTILKEAGSATAEGDSGESAWAKIEKMAEGIVEKSEDLKLNKSAAIKKVLESPMGRDLYAQYLEENPRQLGKN